MRAVLGSVVYRKAEAYLNDFFQSIAEQTTDDFSLLLLNDDMDPQELRRILSGYSLSAEVIFVPDKTPAQLRIELLRQAKQRRVDLLILGDCDDRLSGTRVARVKRAWTENPEDTFFYNELRSMRGARMMPELPKEVCDFKEIGECNFLGLSNAAFNMRKICFDFIDSLEEFSYEIFDWYLFSRLLLEGFCGRKVEDCFTVYRLHANNIAGETNFSETNIRRELEVKQKHYASLKKYHAYYAEKCRQYQKLENCERADARDTYFWWNLLKAIEN